MTAPNNAATLFVTSTDDDNVLSLISEKEKRQAAEFLHKLHGEGLDLTVEDLLNDEDFTSVIDKQVLKTRELKVIAEEAKARAQANRKAKAKVAFLAKVEEDNKIRLVEAEKVNPQTSEVDPAEQAQIEAHRTEIRERLARRDRMTALRVKYPAIPENFLSDPRMVMALRGLLLQKPNQGRGEFGTIHRLQHENKQLGGGIDSECFKLRGKAMKLATQTTNFLKECHVYRHATEDELAQCRHDIARSTLAWIFTSFVEAVKPQPKKQKLTTAQRKARAREKSQKAEDAKGIRRKKG